MFIHYNNFTNEDVPILTESFKSDNENRPCHNAIIQSGKSKFNITFSEKFQFIKDCDKSVSEVVFPRKSTTRLLILILLFIGFLYFGAWSFQMLEHGNESQKRDNFRKIREKFLNDNKCVSEVSLEEFINQVSMLKDMGLSADKNASQENWDIPSGVFFVTTLVTTIGYGNDKPLTVWGKIFCIAFVVIGLPTMMIVATAVIERMCVFTDLTFSFLCYKHKWKITENKFREIQIVFCFFTLVIGFICIPALAFLAMEEGRWNYLDSIYYCIISLTTIGLGDFVPGESPDRTRRNMSKILSTVYLFVGLLWVSFSIQIFHQYQKWNVGSKFFYLRSDFENFDYDTLLHSDSFIPMHDSPEVDELIGYVNIDPVESNFLNNSNERRSRFKSYS